MCTLPIDCNKLFNSIVLGSTRQRPLDPAPCAGGASTPRRKHRRQNARLFLPKPPTMCHRASRRLCAVMTSCSRVRPTLHDRPHTTPAQQRRSGRRSGRAGSRRRSHCRRAPRAPLPTHPPTNRLKKRAGRGAGRQGAHLLGCVATGPAQPGKARRCSPGPGPGPAPPQSPKRRRPPAVHRQPPHRWPGLPLLLRAHRGAWPSPARARCVGRAAARGRRTTSGGKRRHRRLSAALTAL